MKILKLFKKPLFLVSTILLVSLLAVSAFALADAISMQTDFGGTVQSYQVGMQGKINLKLIYDDITKGMDDVDDYYKVTVEGREEYLSYPVSELKKQKNANVISVSLQVTEMNKKVTVTPVKVDSETKAETESGNIAEFSVKHYADRVLGNAGFAGYHDSMRALLNWGAKSETYFKTSGTTADGVFARDTDPVNAVGVDSISAPVHTTETATTGEKFDVAASKLSLVLKDGNVSLCFKLKSTNTAPTLSATLQREDWSDPVDVTAYRNSDGQYVIQVDSITTSLFSKLYTVNISDGDSTMVTQGSVLEVLDKIIEGKDVDSSKPAEQKETAQALYQFYQLTTNNTGASGCYHGSAGTYCVDNGTNDTLKCSKCFSAIKDLPDSVTVYVPAGMMNAPKDKATWEVDEATGTTIKTHPWISPNHFNMVSENVTVNGDGAQYFTFTEGTDHSSTSQFIWNRDKYQTGTDEKTGNPTYSGHTWPSEKFVNNVGNAQYFIIKTRFSENADTRFTVVISTEGTDSRKTYNFPIAAVEAGEWVTYVLPLSLVSDSYKPNADGTYDIDTFYLELYDSTSKPTVDIQYFAFAENWAGVAAVADQDMVVKSVTTSSYGYVDATTGETCVKHIYPQSGSNVGSLVCTYCGYKHPVERYFTPELIQKASMTGTADMEIKSEEDLKFIRISNSKRNAESSNGWSGMTFINSTSTAVTGQYLVMKLRVGENDLGQTLLTFYTTTETNASNDAWVQGGVSVKVSEDNKWHVIVVDLDARVKDGYYEADDGKYVTKYLQMRQFSGVQSSTQSDDYMDIAYIAIVDSLEDIPLIQKDGTYEKSISSTAYTLWNAADNSCASHAPGKTPTVTTVAEGTRYAYLCSNCGSPTYEKIIPSYVSVYVTPDMLNNKSSTAQNDRWNPSTYFNFVDGKGNIELNGNVPYFTFAKGTTHDNTSIFIWNRDNASGVGQRSAHEVYTSNVDNSNYFVIKMRVVDNTQNFTLTISTKGTAENNFVEKDKDGNPTGVLSPYGDPRTTTAIPISATENGEWVTYVFDIEKVFGDSYNPSADGTYDLDTFYFNIYNTGASSAIDMEYFAFVETDLASLKSMVDESEFRLITVKNSTGTPIVTETGTCKNEAHVNVVCDDKCDICGKGELEPSNHIFSTCTSSVVEGNTVWTAPCTKCDYEYKMTVPVGTNFFGDLNTMNCFNNGGSVMTKYLYDEKSGVLYNRLESVNQTHLNITGGTSGGNITSDTYDLGKYLVVKFRTFNGKSITLQPGSEAHRPETGKSAEDYRGVSVGTNKSTEWQVAVIDISGKAYYGTDPITNSNVYMMFMANYADIAYVAVVDSLDEMRALVTDETYYYYGTSFGNANPEHRMTTNDKCATHVAQSTPTITGNVYEYKCFACQTVLRTVTVPTGATYKSPVWIATGAKAYSGGTEKVVKFENGNLFARMTDQIEYIYTRGRADCPRSQSYGDGHLNKFDIGNARYLVFRMRSDNGTKAMQLWYSTTGHDKPTVTETSGSVSLKDGTYYDVNGSKFIIVNKVITEAANGDTESVTYATASGYKDINIPVKTVNNADATGWCTYVIDLATVFNGYHVVDPDTGRYVVDCFYILSNPQTGTFDIESFAFVENKSDITAFTSDEYVYNVTATNACTKISTVDYIAQ